MPRQALAVALLTLVSAPAIPLSVAAQEPRTVVSAAPQRVALTVYRDRYGRGEIDRSDPRGFAMVTETRKIRLPRGRAEVPFEGVAEG
ncbi:MAG: hypothetical protein QM681_14430, partial [Novosphingobium sp.]